MVLVNVIRRSEITLWALIMPPGEVINRVITPILICFDFPYHIMMIPEVKWSCQADVFWFRTIWTDPSTEPGSRISVSWGSSCKRDPIGFHSHALLWVCDWCVPMWASIQKMGGNVGSVVHYRLYHIDQHLALCRNRCGSSFWGLRVNPPFWGFKFLPASVLRLCCVPSCSIQKIIMLDLLFITD